MIKGIHHIVISMKYIVVSVNFYENKLELPFDTDLNSGAKLNWVEPIQDYIKASPYVDLTKKLQWLKK